MRVGYAAALFAGWILVACGGGGGSDGGSGATPVESKSQVSIAAAASTSPIPAGTTTQIDLTVTNASDVSATNVVLTPNLGMGLIQGVVTCASTAGATCPASGTTSFNIPSLPARGSLTFHIAVSTSPGTSGPIVSNPAVTAANDGVAQDNTSDVSVTVYSADVVVSGTGPATSVAAGSTATYTMTVTNNGPDTARDVVIANTVDGHQTLGVITCAAAGGANCPALVEASMTVPSLPKGGTLTFTVPALVAGGTSTAITNVMTASSAADPQEGNNAATVSASSYVASTSGPNAVTLQSDPGDYVGGGQNYAYSNADSILTVSAAGNRLSVHVTGDQSWIGEFQLPNTLTQLQAGTYPNLQRYPFNNPVYGGIDWTGEGRGCNTQKGTVVINSVTYTGGVLSAIDMNFEQHCEGQVAALRGHVHWTSTDGTQAAGPVNPPPAGLWAPAAGVTPSSGSYVYLKSDAGDYIGAGSSYTYTKADAIVSVNAFEGRAVVTVTGNEDWIGNFQAMAGVTQLQPGYYGNLQRYPFNNPVKGGLDWSGDGRGCNVLLGWFVVDSVTYSNGSLSSLDMRFEQHCEGGGPALHGQIHWLSNDATTPPGPVNPPPAGLWQPNPGVTPASGNYVYLASDFGDYIGAGETHLYTPSNAVVSVNGTGAHAGINVSGNENWSGDFQGMNTLIQLQPGYYGSLERFPFHNPVRGGMSWSGEGRGCNTLTGWFVVDNVTYAGGSIVALDLRFEQHCEGWSSALRGKIHWGS
jgi:uncharacterized repeat protein (TIGR01451 family)